jgi:hypothetical protein
MNRENTDWITTVSLLSPSLHDNRADADRLIHALKGQLHTDSIHIDLGLLKVLPGVI